MNVAQLFSIGKSLITKKERKSPVGILKTLVWKRFTVKRIALSLALVAGGLLLKQIRGNGSENVTAEKTKTVAADANKKTMANASGSAVKKGTSKAKARKTAAKSTSAQA